MPDETLIAAARTVEHLAVHFDELRRRATAMRQQVGARQRGYFTPTEDEQVRHLLVSYCQARAALFELVSTLRQQMEWPATLDDARRRAFIVGYAAALLLVDAGRFMRESFDDSPVVCSKLNEPEPSFGIPAGTYDTVQRSLTDPVHAWHLHHATRYYDEHRDELAAVVDADTAFAGALAIAGQLVGRARVAVKRYALARVRVRIRHVVDGVRLTAIGQALYGLQELASRMVSEVQVRPGHHPQVPAQVRDVLRPMLRPGDVFITRKEFALTNYFLPGYWPHAALYLGDAAALQRLGLHEQAQFKPRWAQLLALDQHEPGRVLEALKDGVRLRSLDSPLASDAFVLIRPQLDEHDVAAGLARGLFHEGKPYDFDFDFTRSDRLVCSEVVYRAYEGLGDVRFQLIRRAGRLTLAAEDMLRMALSRRHFQLVAVYCPSRGPDLVTGHAVAAVLQATMGVAADGADGADAGSPDADSAAGADGAVETA